jgi:hypothetical protein
MFKKLKTKIEFAFVTNYLKSYIKHNKMKSWKTSLAGAALAAIIAIQPLVQNGNIDLKRDWPKLGCAACVAVFGFFAKDKDVTGGTTQQ